jgi:hypothetical protein
MALDDGQPELRELPTQNVVEPIEHRVGQVGPGSLAPERPSNA